MNRRSRSFLLTLVLFTSVAIPWDEAQAFEPYIGEIRWVGFNFAPRGWALCDGQLLPINQFTALFSILGTTYGGDGRTTFGLPDMRGRFVVHAGNGPGLTDRRLGGKGGSETVTLTTQQMPSHSHQQRGTNQRGTEAEPAGNTLARQRRERIYDTVAANNPADVSLKAAAIGHTGGDQPHNNMNPYLTIHCIIALEGLFPPRN